MRKFLFLFLFWPICLSAQTWQKAWEGAQKALAKPGNPSLAASRTALLQARQRMTVEQEGMRLWLNGRISPVAPALSERLEAWAVMSNRLLLKDQTLRVQQLDFFKRQAHLPVGLISVFTNVPIDFARGIQESVRFVLCGGRAEDVQAAAAFKKIVTRYQQVFPQRRIIILAEYLPDTGIRFASEFTAAPRHKSFIRSFVKDGFAIAGIGDPSVKEEGYFKQDNSNLILSSQELPAAEAVRGFHIRRRLAQWRQYDPEAVFFLFVSPLAAAYDWRYSLANALPEEEVFSVSMTSVRNTRDFLFHRWNHFQQARPGLLVWKDKKWARMSGFDAQFIFP